MIFIVLAIILAVGIPFYFMQAARAENLRRVAVAALPLVDKPGKEIAGEYDKPFVVQPGGIVRFADFGLFWRGEREMSAEEKKHNDDFRAQGMDGGYITNSYVFSLIEVAEKPARELKLGQMPFSSVSFEVKGTTFTIVPVLNDVALQPSSRSFIVHEGDIDIARQREEMRAIRDYKIAPYEKVFNGAGGMPVHFADFDLLVFGDDEVGVSPRDGQERQSVYLKNGWANFSFNKKSFTIVKPKDGAPKSFVIHEGHMDLSAAMKK